MDPYMIDLDMLDVDIRNRYRNLSTRLTTAQFATLELWARGMSSSEIAGMRGVKEKSINTVKGDIRRELTTKEGSEADAIALAAYWIWKYARA